ncbi:Protein CBR-FLP-5 [Caenorhabditis briggsae]|uniref:Uncharacterized protein n=3 Tax=Caenorhabditis briggsae TaxID=6238 RepID=A0AAE9FN08_CAEBR|nr:Protein CBR-FLP-5 [Caenorhabditis briggsae]UMM43255.1 hypothetical protein L5515_018824 [Caenorhabditis briggsae]CAP39298.1 Protein CBR-FLP-5 [Caenorhabditis briggsae]
MRSFSPPFQPRLPLPPLLNRSFLATMSSRSTTIAFLFIATLLVFQCVSAQLSDEETSFLDQYQRVARAPKPKFIRFGRAGAKFIRFGRSGANTWEDGYAAAAPSVNDLYVKRGAKFIRFG